MWELDCEESWVPKNWCFWTGVLEKTLESPLDCKEIQPVHPKGDQSWVFIGRTDAEAETPILRPLDMKKWLIWKNNVRPWFWEGLGAGGEGDDRGWDGWMASLTQWAWVCVNSGSWWWTWRPVVLRFMGLQRVGHDWTEMNWKIYKVRSSYETYNNLLVWLFKDSFWVKHSANLLGLVYAYCINQFRPLGSSSNIYACRSEFSYLFYLSFCLILSIHINTYLVNSLYITQKVINYTYSLFLKYYLPFYY